MAKRNTARSAAKKAATIGWMAPQVIALRITRMWMAGPTPAARERREMHRMVAEKLAASQESAWAMNRTLLAAQTTLARQWWALWLPAVGPKPASQRRTLTGLGLAYRIADAGLTPFSRRVQHNLRRLGK